MATGAREQFDDSSYNEAVLNETILALDSFIGPTATIDYLDDLHESNPGLWHRATQLLPELPSEFILNYYDEEILVWAAMNTRNWYRTQSHLQALHDLAGYDGRLLEKAQSWRWEKERSRKGRDILMQYAISDFLLHDALADIDLPHLLRTSAEPGVVISDKRAGDYTLTPVAVPDTAIDGYQKIIPEAVPAGTRYWIYMDAPLGFLLNYKGRPNALVSVGLSGNEELMIYQLQGIQGQQTDPLQRYSSDSATRTISARGLAPLDWRKLLVNLMTNVVAAMQLPSVGIQAAAHNRWVTRIELSELEPRFKKEKALKAYDETAERLGFTKGSDGNWHKALMGKTY